MGAAVTSYARLGTMDVAREPHTLWERRATRTTRRKSGSRIASTTGAVVIVTNSLPTKSIQELVALAKSKPDELTYGSTGNGTPGHLNGALFSKLAAIKTVHVPYRVGGQGTTDLIAGRISFWIAPIPTRLQQVANGELRALAVAGRDRSADLPGVPSIKESGIDFDASTTYAVFAPRGAPPEVTDRLYMEIQRALNDERVQQRFRAAGVEPKLGAPADVTRLIEAQIPLWASVIASSGITID